MAAMTLAFGKREIQAARFDLRTMLLNEATGLVIGIVTVAWILGSLGAL